jgi:NADH dehydrogenase FAD-containing subunit
VLVVGMGDTGVLVAVHLGRRVEVTGVAARPALVSGQELGTRLADPRRWRRSYLVALSRFRRLDRARLLHGEVRRLDLSSGEAEVALAGGGTTVVGWDALVIATGVSNGFWRRHRVEDLDDVERGLDQVAAEIAAAGSIAVVGGGATGVSAAANLARRHPEKTVHLFFSGEQPLPGYHPRVRDELTAELQRSGVVLHTGHRAVLPDGFGADRLTKGPVEWSTGQDAVEADVTLWAVGAVRPNTDWLPADLLDEQGFVRVDERLAVPGHPRVFAVGDVAASDPHRSSARNWGWRIVCHNVRVATTGRGRLRRYSAPPHRWGSILGVQPEGMVVHQPDGRSFRVPRWLADPLLFRGFVEGYLYGGLRRARWRRPNGGDGTGSPGARSEPM